MDDKQQTLCEAATAWMDENVIVMDHFRRFAEQMRERNRKFGMKLIAERVRWEMHLRGADDESDFNVNNNYVAYISRRLCQDDPRLADLIRCRVTRAAHKPINPPRADQEVDPLTDDPI